MPFLRPARSVQTKLLVLVTGFVVTFAGYVMVRNAILERVRINGPLYQDLKQRHALLIDITRPHLLLAESYFNAMQLLDAVATRNQARVALLLSAHNTLVAEHGVAAGYWRNRPPDPEAMVTLERAVALGSELVRLLDSEVVPALRRGEVEYARSLLATRGTRLFAAHRAATEELAAISRKIAAAHEAEAEQFAARWKTLLTLVGIGLVVLFAAIAVWGARSVVVRPLRMAIRHFETIGLGDYAQPVHTSRGDEFGDMLRALDRMRVNLSEMESELRTAETRYRTILERSVQGFYEVTPEGQLLSVNESFARMLGYGSPTELLAIPAERLHVDGARRADLWREINEKGFVSGFRTQLRRNDGRAIWVSEFARGVFDDAGRCTHAEGFLEDITANVEAEQLKSEFVAFVTHQLRTPLAGIRWMVELAQQSEPVSPEVASFLEDARISAERLIALVNDLMDITQLEEGRLRSVAEQLDLVKLTHDVVTELAPATRSKQHSVTITGTDRAIICADPQLVRQAVVNVISNAVKYTPAGGTITVNTVSDDRSVRLSVRDTGIGIPLASQRRIFEKFFRAENAQTVDTEGTGLGLYLVRLIAERSGGSVACESVENEGSAFTLTLPLAHQRKAVA
jgi:two-component system phosphate regulon sensor histidine kinase PhoR